MTLKCLRCLDLSEQVFACVCSLLRFASRRLGSTEHYLINTVYPSSCENVGGVKHIQVRSTPYFKDVFHYEYGFLVPSPLNVALPNKCHRTGKHQNTIWENSNDQHVSVRGWSQIRISGVGPRRMGESFVKDP